MTSYILHAAIFVAGCLIFYKVLLEKETFYKLNRLWLLACIYLSFILPLIPIPQQWSFRKEIYQTEQQASVTSQRVAPSSATIPLSGTYNILSRVNSWVFFVYWAGVIILGISFFIQLIILICRAKFSPSVMDNGFRIVELSGDKAPCSFGKNIFINPTKYDWDTYNQILQHEKVHIRQGHSGDILLAEVMIIFQWFNPFAWWYRTEIDNNLEFLTDDNLVHSQHINKESYQMSLLKVSAPHFPLGLTTNYNQSLLKRRFEMMNTKRSNFNVLWKYIALIPILTVLVCGLNKSDAQNNPTSNKVISNSTKPAQSQSFNENAVRKENQQVIKPGKIEPDQARDTVADSVDIFSLQNLGITSTYITSFKEIGYNNLSLQDLKVLRMLGVTASYLKGFQDIGYDHLSLKTIKDLKLNGITPLYVKELQDAGYRGLSLNQLPLHK